MVKRVFLSHSSQDNEAARLLAASLDAQGFDVWVDFEDIQDGERWVQAIQRGLEQSEAVVILMSRHAHRSEWVEREALFAGDLKLPIFIALLEPIRLPLYLINRQYTDFFTDGELGLSRLITALRQDADDAPQPDDDADDSLPELNFDTFVRYLALDPKRGESAAQIARELYEWGRSEADQVSFGGKNTPGMYFHLTLSTEDDAADEDDADVLMCALLAYLRRPKLMIYFDLLSRHAPYDQAALRRSTLASLNALMPEKDRFLPDRADRRPTLPLDSALETSAQRQQLFQILAEMLDNLRGA